MESALPATPPATPSELHYLEIPIRDCRTHCEIDARFGDQPQKLLIGTNSLAPWMGFRGHPYDGKNPFGQPLEFTCLGRTFVGVRYYELMTLGTFKFLQLVAVPTGLGQGVAVRSGLGQGIAVPGGSKKPFKFDGVLSLAAPDMSLPGRWSLLDEDSLFDSLKARDAIDTLRVTIIKGKTMIFGTPPIPPEVFTVPVTKTLPYCDFWGFQASLEYDGHEIVSSTGIIDYTQPYLGLDAESFQKFPRRD